MVIQYLLIAVLLAVLAHTWRRARQGALGRTAAFLWSIFWIASGVVVLRPEFATSFASFLGVGRGADAVIYLAIIALFYLVFRIFLRLDRLDRDITSLVRMVSLMAEGRDEASKRQ
jgi:hypothetical protein